jgi:hypothetical protein
MGEAVTHQAAPGEQEPADPTPDEATCIGCGSVLEGVLQQLGSLRCHDCRDGASIGSLERGG